MTRVADGCRLSAFFSQSNDWDLEKIEKGAYPAELQAHLEAMVRPALEGRVPFVLPRLDAETRLWFYVVAQDRRQLTELDLVLRAHLGTVRSRCDPQVYIQSEDPVEKAVLDIYPQGFLKISIPKELNSHRSHVYSVFGSINAALNRYSERPLSIAVAQRSIGRILSDFFGACDRHDGSAANELVEELRASGKLGVRNLLSAELQALAAGREWRALLNHPNLNDILGGRIPAGVAEVILEALRYTEVRSDSPNDYKIQALQARLEPVSQLFLRTPSMSPRADLNLWKVWAIGAVAFGYSRASEVVSELRLGRQWIEELHGWGELAPKPDNSSLEFRADLRSEPSIENAVKLLQRALALNPTEGLEVYRRLCDYPLNVLKELEAHSALRGVWVSLQEDFALQRKVDSWSAWLKSLLQSSSESVSIHAISEACRGWEPSSWNEDEIRAHLLGLADTNSALLFREGIPLLRKWLRDSDIQSSAAFTEQVLLVLAVDEIHSTQDLALVADLIGDLAAVPHTKEQYQEGVGAAMEIWRRAKSIVGLDGGLDVMDVLLDSVCADPEIRLRFWLPLQEFCLAEWRRLSEDQQLLVRETSKAVTGSSEQFPARRSAQAVAGQEKIDLAGKRLAIYTLMEGAGRRAKAVLNELFPGLEIQLNHDTYATNALLHLADSVDYFVFATQSAAHQAFYPVVKRREEILYPAGKGSSSIVRCFLDALSR